MKIVLGLTLFVGTILASEWSYTDVDHWEDRAGTSCGGSSQSPIDIPHATTYSSFAAFSMTGYDSVAGHVTLKNNGHTAQVDLDASQWGTVSLSGGGLDGDYSAIQLHFHWGTDDGEGSEHTFRGHKYPLEMHIVHYKASHGSVAEALNYADGIAVLGFFFATEDADENASLNELITALSAITHKDDNTSVNLNFDDLMPTERTDFYRYNGSLTTPECFESVVWTVFDHVNTISPTQMAKFRTLYENVQGETNHQMDFNFRPTQPLNGRTVYKNYDADVATSYHWGYEGVEGPSYWPLHYATCGNDKQSPINIPKESTYDATKALSLASLEFRNYHKLINGTLKNNGHTVQIDISNSEQYLTNGDLLGNYTAEQLHFHWGENNNRGSEHTYTENGIEKQYPLEMHVVHWKTEYGSLVDSLGHEDGLAVVGFFFDISSSYNTGLAPLITALPDVSRKDSNKAFNGFSLQQFTYSTLKLDANTGFHVPMYRYKGSLTTPSCLEIVTWTVMKTPIPIHADQLAVFRDMTHITGENPTSHDYITKNYRPVQPLGSRTIYSSYDYTTDSDSAADVLPNIIVLTAVIIVAFLFK